MTDTDTEFQAATAEEWTKRRRTRASLFAIMGGVLILANLWTIGQTWLSLSDTPNTACTTAGPYNPTVTPKVSALDMQRKLPVLVPGPGCYTGWSLLEAQSTPTEVTGSLGAHNVPQIPVTFSIPTVNAMLMLAGLALVAGSLLRNSIWIVAGVIPWWLSLTNMDVTKKALTWGHQPTEISFGVGLNVLALVSTLLLAMIFVATIFVVKVNRQARIAHAQRTGASPAPAALVTVASWLRVAHPGSDMDGDNHQNSGT